MSQPKRDAKTGTWYFVADVASKGAPRKQIRRRGFPTRKAAQAALNEVTHALGEGTFAAPNKQTVAELCENDITTQTRLGKMRPSTADGYRRWLDTHVREGIGAIRAQELRASHLDRFYGELLEGGRRQAAGARGAGLSPSSVRLVHAFISGAFSRAVKRGDVASNPCVRANPPASSTGETPSWSLEQLQAFLAHDAVRTDKDAALWRVMAATGLRRGEALGLGWDDVELDAGVIHVRRNATMSGDTVVLGEPKTKRSRRRIRVGPDSVQVLRDHLAQQRELRIALGAAWHDHGLVFPGPDGRPRNTRTVSSAFSKLVGKTGLPRVTLHSLRHQHGTLLLDQGERIHDVAARLGHDPAVLLRVYAHHGSDSQDSAAALETLLDGERPPLRVVPGEAAKAENDQGQPPIEGSEQRGESG